MPTSTRQELIDYCLRRLGAPVIKINVDEMQLEDRIDDAIAFFTDYHFDGVQQLYLRHQITQEDIDNTYITIPQSVIAVTGVVAMDQSKTAGFNPFDVNYQLRQSELYNFSNMSIIHYDMMQSYLSLLKFEFNSQPRLQFNRYQGKMFLNISWKTQLGVGDYLIIECYRVLDPAQYPLVWNDRFLRDYATALIKRQWAANLKKFAGVQLPGGVTLDGNSMYSEADAEVQRIEEQMQQRYELPTNFLVG